MGMKFVFVMMGELLAKPIKNDLKTLIDSLSEGHYCYKEIIVLIAYT